MEKYQDGFVFEDEQEVTNVEKSKFLLVKFKDTIFYPGGGGQPCDTGTIETKNFLGEVVDVYKEKDKIIHKVNPKKGTLKKGDKARLKIDKEKKIKIIKMHTGEHVLFKSIEKSAENVSLVKITLGEDESVLFIKAKELTWERLFKAEELANRIIKEDREVIEKEYPKKEAIELGKLRIKPDKIKSDTVRVVQVKDFDWSACTGTHAKSTGFIQNILISHFSVTKGSWEIRFKTDVEAELFKLSQITRKTASLLQTDTRNVFNYIEKLQEDVDLYKEKYRNLSSKLLDYYKEEEINGIHFVYNIVEGVEKKQLTDKANSLQKGKTVVCFINKMEKRNTILLNSSGLDINIPKLLNKVISKYNGKGGGRDNFAMGSLESGNEKAVIEGIQKELRKV